MIRCLAIDDEPLALQQIAAYIGKVPFLELAAQCQSALEAHQFLQNDTVDVIFCDINMPDLNGMDFIKALVAPPLVVFTTAYAEYAVEGFKVNAVDYLLKPFGLQDFMRAANRVRERLEGTTATAPAPSAPVASDSDADTIFLKTDYRIVKVAISDIRYVEAMSEYLKVWMEGDTKRKNGCPTISCGFTVPTLSTSRRSWRSTRTVSSWTATPFFPSAICTRKRSKITSTRNFLANNLLFSR